MERNSEYYRQCAIARMAIRSGKGRQAEKDIEEMKILLRELEEESKNQRK